MKKQHILSGEELVAKGATKHEVSLPELGLKDVQPNGSWLEQKQIQAALEARKHLVEVERIEKCGVLSHAEWNPDTGLAEVTQQVGGYWQHLGHYANRKLCLWPEEALYLMETNCLQLKYNETTVSLQQAYSLLLQWKITYLQYRVYASLSRLGYKILRHNQAKKAKNTEQQNAEEKSTEECGTKEVMNEEVRVTKSDDTVGVGIENNEVESDSAMETSEAEKLSVAAIATPQIETTEVEPIASCSKAKGAEPASKSVEETRPKIVLSRKQIMLQQLMNRATCKKPAKEDLDRLFSNLPEMCQTRSVTVTVPEEQHLPRNVFLNNTSYTLNLEKVRNRTTSVSPTNSRAYSVGDEVNEPSMGRIWASSTVPPMPTQNVWSQPNFPNIQSMQNGFNPQLWNFMQQRPRFSQYLFGYVYQRPLLAHLNFNMPRFSQGRFQRNQPFFARPPQSFRGFTGQPHNGMANHRLSRKRSRDGAGGGPNLYAIRLLAAKLKQLVGNNNSNQQENIQSLQRIVNTYNRTYSTDIRLSNNLEIVDAQENIVETITLEDDDEPKSKRVNIETKAYEENLNRIKKLALTLRKLDQTGKGTSKHRRAFSNMLKNFNKTYDADIYMEKYEVIDRKLILLDSSEDDCVVEESPKVKKKSGKKLRNPFSFLNLALDQPSTSDANLAATKHKELSTIFRDWLPKDDDFGRPAILSKGRASTYDCNEEYLLDFITNYKNDCDNWNHIKMSFWEGVEDISLKPECNGTKNSLVKPEDCKNMASVFEKLRIVQCCKEGKSDSNLLIDFDVYNRDVPNFKKSNPPSPHFRIVCLNESDDLPSGADVQAVHDMNADSVPTVFAVVGVASVSYLQLRPTELPLRMPSGEDT